ncbi:uncharacterized protein [Atheta coriaria]|uniref:uncharacterized protein n=1 Tax=Dalotia coriaria TaxID=877792 RepID=UPI0031F46B66
MNSRLDVYKPSSKFLPVIRLDKHLRTRKGSRLGNSGNRLELQVLTQLHHVP